MSPWYWLLWMVLSVGNAVLCVASFWNLRRTQRLLNSERFLHHCGDDDCMEAHP